MSLLIDNLDWSQSGVSRSQTTCRIALPWSKPRTKKRSHQHLLFTTKKDKVAPLQVQELWSTTGYRHSREEKVQVALEHTFAIAAAHSTKYLTGTNSPGTAAHPRLVGFARHAARACACIACCCGPSWKVLHVLHSVCRAMSDGAFAALIVDVVVHEDCRVRMHLNQRSWLHAWHNCCAMRSSF